MSPLQTRSNQRISRSLRFLFTLFLLAVAGYAVTERFWLGRTPFNFLFIRNDNKAPMVRHLKSLIDISVPVHIVGPNDIEMIFSPKDTIYDEVLSDLDCEVVRLSDWQDLRKYRAKKRRSIAFYQSDTPMFWLKGAGFVEFPEQDGDRSIWRATRPIGLELNRLIDAAVSAEWAVPTDTASSSRAAAKQ